MYFRLLCGTSTEIFSESYARFTFSTVFLETASKIFLFTKIDLAGNRISLVFRILTMTEAREVRRDNVVHDMVDIRKVRFNASSYNGIGKRWYTI